MIVTYRGSGGRREELGCWEVLVCAGERFEGAGEYVMGFEGSGEYFKGDGEGMLDTGAGALTNMLSCCAFSKSRNGSSNLIWNPPERGSFLSACRLRF